MITPDIPDSSLLEKYAPPPSQFIDLATSAGSIRIHYRDQGNKSGPCLLFFHGSQSSLHTWEPWVKLLENDCRLVTLDLPGHGFTGPMPADDYSITAMMDVVYRFVETLSLSRFTVVGNSWGGIFAMMYAVEKPEQVEKMVLIDTAGYHVPDPLSCQLLRLRPIEALFQFCTPRSFIRSELADCYSDRSKVTDEVFERYYQLMLRQGNRRAQLLLNRPKDAYRAPLEVLDKLHQLKVPALIMWGKADPWFSLELAQKYHQALSNSELVVYDNAGHLAMEEIPETSAVDLRRFVLADKMSGAKR